MRLYPNSTPSAQATFGASRARETHRRLTGVLPCPTIALTEGNSFALPPSLAQGCSSPAWRRLRLLAKGQPKDSAQPKPEEDVSPAEDLMREHGVLKRVMLVYDEVLRRWDKKEDVPPEILADASGMIRYFVEDYHEKLEEDYLFPRFEKANKLTDLVKTLLTAAWPMFPVIV